MNIKLSAPLSRVKVFGGAAGVLLLSMVLLLGGCERKPQVYQQEILALGTLVDLVIYGVDDKTGREAGEKVTAILEEIHHDWHAWQPSKLTKINSELEAGKPAILDEAGRKLIASGIKLSKESGDLFDPAAGKLIEIWGFHQDERINPVPPPAAEIAAVVATHPRMSELHLEGNVLTSPNPAVQLDLGGYAKGYAVDLSIAALKEMGIDNAIVNAGGDLRAIGDKNGRPWRIGIRDPRGPGVIASVDVEGDESVFTSGDYERYFEYQGKRYHHIIDPRDGYPARGASSVTIINRDATTADAAATAMLIAGPKDWLKVAKSMGIVQAMLIDEAGTVYMTPAMAKRTRMEVDPLPKMVISELP